MLHECSQHGSLTTDLKIELLRKKIIDSKTQAR